MPSFVLVHTAADAAGLSEYGVLKAVLLGQVRHQVVMGRQVWVVLDDVLKLPQSRKQLISA